MQLSFQFFRREEELHEKTLQAALIVFELGLLEKNVKRLATLGGRSGFGHQPGTRTVPGPQHSGSRAGVKTTPGPRIQPVSTRSAGEDQCFWRAASRDGSRSAVSLGCFRPPRFTHQTFHQGFGGGLGPSGAAGPVSPFVARVAGKGL